MLVIPIVDCWEEIFRQPWIPSDKSNKPVDPDPLGMYRESERKKARLQSAKVRKKSDSLQWLHQCVEAAKALSLDVSVHNNLLVDLWVMGGLVHPAEAIADLLAEEIMQDSSVYQHITEKARAEGLERGAKESTIENILMFLDDRLENVNTEGLKPTLEAIDDLQRLRYLLREAAKTESLEAFIIHLANGSKN